MARPIPPLAPVTATTWVVNARASLSAECVVGAAVAAINISDGSSCSAGAVVHPTDHRSFSAGSPPASANWWRIWASWRWSPVGISARMAAMRVRRRAITPSTNRWPFLVRLSRRCRRSAGLSRRSSSFAATNRSQVRVALEGCRPIASASAAECIGPRLAMITNARNWLTPMDSSAAAIDRVATPTRTRAAASTASVTSSRPASRRTPDPGFIDSSVHSTEYARNPCVAATVSGRPDGLQHE